VRQGVLGTPRGEAIRLLLTAANRVLPHTRSLALRVGGAEVMKKRTRTHTTHIPVYTLGMGKTHARMLGRHGPPWSAEIAADGRIFEKARSDHKNGRNRRACVASPPLGCTPTTPHPQPAPLSTLSKLSCV
jgi:hypothetical protein